MDFLAENYPNSISALKISPALFGFFSSELRFEEKSSRGRNFRGNRTSLNCDVNPNNPAQEAYKKWGFKIDKYRMSLKF